MNDTVSLEGADLCVPWTCGMDCYLPKPKHLQVGALRVFLAHARTITIAAGAATPEEGGNYIAMDLSPADARCLALLLLAASDDADDLPVDAEPGSASERRALFALGTMAPATSTDVLGIARSVWGDDLVEPATPS